MKAARMLKTFLAGGSLFLMLCMRGGTDTGNARVVGMVYNADGSRAHAEVVFVPSGYNPNGGQNLQHSVSTNDTGAYQFDSLPPGTYNILGNGSTGIAFKDSIKIGDDRIVVPPCTLSAPGSVSGLIEIEPGDNPAQALVAVLGTNTLCFTGANGKFEIDSLAAGTYTLWILSSGAYNTFDTMVTIEPGSNLQLANPIRLRALNPGIPVPTGLTAVYDTLRQAVSISWRRVNDDQVQGYALWRKNADLNLALEQVPPRTLRDTFYFDTTCTPSGDGVTYEYHVRVVDTNDNQSANSGGVKVFAVPRYFITTTIVLSLSGNFLQPDSTLPAPPFDIKPFTMLNDSVAVVANYFNPTRLVKKVEWFSDGEAYPRKTDFKSDSAGTDTIRIAWPFAGIHSVRFKATDNGGTVWQDSLLIEAISNYLPVISAGPDTTVPRHASLRLHPTSAASPSKIIKWEWNIGNSGFAAVSGGDTTITVPDSVIPAWPCILRATNDHNYIAKDTMVIRVGQ